MTGRRAAGSAGRGTNAFFWRFLRDALSQGEAECTSLEMARLFAVLPVAVLRNS
jgi:hypothetical protein